MASVVLGHFKVLLLQCEQQEEAVMSCIVSPWWMNVDNVAGRRCEQGGRFSVEQDCDQSTLLSGWLPALAAHQLHAALFHNMQHLQYQHAGPVHWGAE